MRRLEYDWRVTNYNSVYALSSDHTFSLPRPEKWLTIQQAEPFILGKVRQFRAPKSDWNQFTSNLVKFSNPDSGTLLAAEHVVQLCTDSDALSISGQRYRISPSKLYLMNFLEKVRANYNKINCAKYFRSCMQSLSTIIHSGQSIINGRLRDL